MKRIVSWALALLMIITVIPADVYAIEAEGRSSKPKMVGDVNGDNKSDLVDLHMLKKYLKDGGEINPGASIDGDDSSINMADLKALQLIMVGAEHVITFYDDEGGVIDVLPEKITEDNNDIGQIPTVGRSSRKDKVLVGYYNDKTFTSDSIYYADNKLGKGDNPVVYGKYEYMPALEEALTFSSFSNMEADSNISFTIKQVIENEVVEKLPSLENTPDVTDSENENVLENTQEEEKQIVPAIEDAYSLEVKDGSGPVTIEHREIADKTYRIVAPKGYKEGATYELSLGYGWNFVNTDGSLRSDSVRSAVFAIKKSEITKLSMNSSIKYIADNSAIDYYIGGLESRIEVLKDSDVTSEGGYFYLNAVPETPAEQPNEVIPTDIAVGDTICIYTGICPTERDIKDGKSILDPAVYVKVTKVEGNKISFERISEDNISDVYNIVDNFPIKVSSCPILDKNSSAKGTANIDDIDIDVYKQVWEIDEEAEWKDVIEQVYEKINVGDFVTFYEDVENFYSGYESSLFVAEITSYDPETHSFEYKESSVAAIDQSMETFVEGAISGEAVLTDLQIGMLEEQIEEQVNDGDFAQAAAYALMDVASSSEGYPENAIVKDEDGNPLSGEQLQLLGKGKGFELTKINVAARILNKGKELHFKKGLQLRLSVDATFEVEAKEGTIQIDLSSSFIQEVQLTPTVKSSAVKKLGIPVGVNLTANIDLMSYTNFNFEANIYTVAPDKEFGWLNYQKFLDESADKIGDKLLGELFPGKTAAFLKGLTVSDVIEAVELLKVGAESEGSVGVNDTIVNDVWKALGDRNVMGSTAFTQSQIDSLTASVEKTTIKNDFKELMDLGNNGAVSSKYSMAVRQLMEKYADMVNRDTDWVKIVEQEIGQVTASFYGITVGVYFTFNVYTDISMSIGSSIEYEVGKRFSFWFKVGLFKPSSGSSTTDIIDEKFAFQFYVMGRLGVRAGVKAKLGISLVTPKLASVGVAAEIGPYIKLYGFFIYNHTSCKPVNSNVKATTDEKAGALYLDFGLYFTAGFEAEVLNGLASYSKNLADKELSLLTVGEKKYYFESAYEPKSNESYYIVDKDKNGTNGISMPVSDEFFSLRYIDLVSGTFGTEVLDARKFNITLSNPNFSWNFDDEGKLWISVTPEKNARIDWCDMTISYKCSKLAFSQYDMTTTIPLVWSNLAESEKNQYYTVKVRVGNKEDGYNTVWSKRVLKSQPFNLPTDTEIKNLIEFDEMIHVATTGYGSQQTRNLTVTRDTVYDYDIGFRDFKLTVQDIQRENGEVYSEVFTARYGKSFNFYKLNKTGSYLPDEGVFTKFAGVTTDEEITVGGQTSVMDLSTPITGDMAKVLAKGIVAKANYVDDSVTATFELKGVVIKTTTETVEIGKSETTESKIEEDENKNVELTEEEKAAKDAENKAQQSDEAEGTGEDKQTGEVEGTGEDKSEGEAEGTDITQSEGEAEGEETTPEGQEIIITETVQTPVSNEPLIEEIDIKVIHMEEETETGTNETETVTEVTETTKVGESIKITVQKGTTPALDKLYELQNKEEHSMLIDISPEVGDLESDTFFTAVYGAAEGDKGTVIFYSGDGASTIRTIHRIVGQPMSLPTPKKGECDFEGWYTDEKFENRVTSMTRVPSGETKLYAKWNQELQVEFNANGGEAPSMLYKKVKAGAPFGPLASVKSKDSSQKFLGWFTSAEGGELITPATIVEDPNKKTDDTTGGGNSTDGGGIITLYAQWSEIPDLSNKWLNVNYKVYEYDSNEHVIDYTVKSGEGIPQKGYAFKYKKQGDKEYMEGHPVEEGVYDVEVSCEGTNSTVYLKNVLEIAYTPYEVNGCWYQVSFAERGSVGGAAKQRGSITWSNGQRSDTHLDIDKKWNSASFSMPCASPKTISTEPGAKAFGVQTVYIKSVAKDVLGNEKVLVEYDKYGTRRPNESFDVSSKIQSVSTGSEITISTKSKARISMITYGVNGPLDNRKITYSSNFSNALTPDPDHCGCLILDGAYLPPDVTVKMIVRANGKDVAELTVNTTQ